MAKTTKKTETKKTVVKEEVKIPKPHKQEEVKDVEEVKEYEQKGQAHTIYDDKGGWIQKYKD